MLCISLYALQQVLFATIYNPAVAVPAYKWLAAHGLVRSERETQFDDLYPVIDIQTLNKSKFFEARAAVVGRVTATMASPDGDVHINITDARGNTLVAEMVPEYPLPIPQVGETIKIWGVTRYDLDYFWWELHPVFGWEKQ